MNSIILDSDDSFDDSIDDLALSKALDHPNSVLPTTTPKHVTAVYEEINPSNSNPTNSSSPTIQKYINYDNINTFIYPTNLETRDYQFDIVQKSLYQNLLCAIPTGLGKTFIASTLMLNFFNWTKELKIIFMAPTKPLVAQQIKAFIQISGISMTYTDILLDRTRRNRKDIWDNKRILFTTPQVVDNDLKSGILDPNLVGLLIIDEAHRARGNYAYTNVVKFLNRFNSSFRILALTATPGSDIESIQSVVENLNISKIELRTEKDPDIAKYIKTKTIDKLDCSQTDEIIEIIDLISEAIRPILEKANEYEIYDIKDPSKINHFVAMEKSQKIIKNPSIPEGLKWSYYFILQLLGTVGQFFRRLNIYGVKTFYSYFLEKYTEFTTKYSNKKSTNKLAASFYYDDKIVYLKKYVENLIEKDKQKAKSDPTHIEGMFSHLKLKSLVDELIEFFSPSSFTSSSKSSSSCIIFTEYRESALEIVKVLENTNKVLGRDLIRPHIFIGQSKEKDKFDQQAYMDKIKPKRKKKGEENEPAKKTSKKKEIERPTDRLGSSENAQLKGMNQKTQKELIENFKSGEYNTLVATSIGEEGLDIGEVDLIVCFDSTQSPIKNIQRMGRTGRKRDGKVLLLFSSNERSKFESSMGKYEWIQNQIKNDCNKIEYFDGSNNRIVPKNIMPVLEKKYIEIPKENEDLLKDSDVVDTDEFLKLATQTIQSKNNPKGKSKSKAKSKSKSKKKYEDDPKQMKLDKRFFLPQNAELGFKPVSQMVTKKYVDKNGNEVVNTTKKSSDPLVLDSDESDNDALNINFSNNGNKSKAEESVTDLFSSIIGSSNNNEVSIDLTGDGDDGGDNVNVTADNSAPNPGSNDDPIILSDDDFSDISFNEIDRNVISKPNISVQSSVINNQNHNTSPTKKRKLHDLSSDVFSDEIDDAELIAQLNKISESNNDNSSSVKNQEPRPAKRNRL